MEVRRASLARSVEFSVVWNSGEGDLADLPQLRPSAVEVNSVAVELRQASRVILHAHAELAIHPKPLISSNSR